MDLQSLLPIIVVALVGLVVLRLVIGLVRISGKLMLWIVVAAAIFGLGYVWYENQDPTARPELPTLNIPADSESAN